MKAPQDFESVWPAPFSKLNETVLRHMPEKDFALLCHYVYKRAKRAGIPKRRAKSLVRKLHRRRKGLKPWPELKQARPQLFFARYRPSPILDGLYPNRENNWRMPSSRRDIGSIQLENFSFIDDPVGTLKTLQRVTIAEAGFRWATIDFLDDRINDISPYIVLGVMRKDMAPFVVGGSISTPVKKVIEAVGLRNFMSIERFPDLQKTKDVWAFKLRQRHAAGTSKAEAYAAISESLVADELVDTVDEWLGALPTPHELLPSARASLSRIVTEMLENAQRHSRLDQDGDWYAAGFMARRDEENDDERFDCHIAFVNLGDTISTAISRSPPNIKSDLNIYTKRHKRRGQSETTLATLYALQDGVSSLPAGRGGKGMMEMVDLTNALGYTTQHVHRPAITLISGNSCIHFRDKFHGCEVSESPGKPRFQAFNETQEFDLPPDSAYVYDLENHFPGTIVAIRFSFDPQELERMNDNGQSDTLHG